jgi:hypothetical protein
MKQRNQTMQENPDKTNAPDDRIRWLSVEEAAISPEVKKEVWRNIEASTLEKGWKLPLIFRYAAAIALLVAISLYLIVNKEERKIDYEAVIAVAIVEKAAENVVIVLPSHEKIEIEEQNVELILDTEGKISVNSKVLKENKQAAGTTPACYQIIVPYGKTSSMVMNDGTKVWINSGSRVVYPALFSDRQREMYVEGEVYLEVARKPGCPFVLQTEELEVSVLGTSFNVSAYKNDAFQSVVLTTGSVSVKGKKQNTSSLIKPNQKYTFENDTQQSRLEEVDVLSYISWKYGFLIFQKEKLNNVLKKIERYYNRPISCNPVEMERITVSGKLDLKEDIEETFRIISIAAPIGYAIEDDGINIYVKP